MLGIGAGAGFEAAFASFASGFVSGLDGSSARVALAGRRRMRVVIHNPGRSFEVIGIAFL
jgi:hypothetical protein